MGPAAERFGFAPVVVCGGRSPGDDGRTGGGKAQHGLRRRLHARLHRSTRGGTIRDVLLGHYPLVWVQHPSYLLLAAGAALATILLARLVHRLNTAFLVLDAIGRVVFTMAGCDIAWQVDASLPLVVVVVAGMITGCAGGVLRDVLCNDVPLLFRAELYASVSIVIGLFYSTAFGLKLNDELWTALSFVLGLTFRLLAIRYKWEMPKFVFSDDQR